MKRILMYIRPHYGRMAVGFLIKFIGTIMDLALPWILAHMIDVVAPTRNTRNIFLWGAVMTVCAALALFSNIIANRRASAVARDATRTLRRDLFEHTSRLSARQIDRLTIPSLISRLNTDSYSISTTLARMQRIGVRAPILLIGGVVVTMMMDFRLSLVLLATLPLLALGVAIISLNGIPLYAKVQKAVDMMIRTVRDDVTGIRVIRALSKGDYECARFHADNCTLCDEQFRADSVMAATNPVMNLLLNGGLTAVVVTGAFLVSRNLTEPGKIIAFLSYFTIILNALLIVNRIFIMISRVTVSAQRIDEVLSMPIEEPDENLPAADGSAHIVFDDVCFSYNGQHNDLDHLSFRLNRGETLGVIGATGSGKTTLIQLLQRFYRADSGTISINGENVNSIDDATLHTMFGVAFQSDAFFAGTIRENITLGRPLSDEQIRRAARCAQASEFIDALPDGYEHRVETKAVNLSGGQRQRLLIARALAGNPEILILDDSSSALDYRTDAAMRAAVAAEYPDTTTILIAQRVSSVRHSDRILVLENGESVGLDRHDALMEHCPLYAQISRIQTDETENETKGGE